MVIKGGYGNDSISVMSNNSFVDAGDSNDYISNVSENATIKGGDGNDTLVNSVLISYYSESGSIINNKGINSIMDGGTGNDNIWNSSSSCINVTLIGGTGQDTLINTASKVTIDAGDDNDFIRNYGSSSSRPSNVSISAGSGNDTIHDDGNQYTTINAGLGDDYVSIKSGKNYFIQYANGDGKDTIYGYISTDTIQIAGSSYSTQNSGTKDILVNIGSGSMLLVDAADKTLNMVMIEDENPTPITIDGLNITNYNNYSLISATAYNDTIYNNGSKVKIYSDSGNDSICNYGNNVTINTGKGNDSICNDNSYVTINAGAGDDYIYNKYGTKLVTINAGEGNDSIFNSHSSYATINAGAGDDYIYNEYASNWVKIYAGEGNDTIENEFNDRVTVNGGTGNDVIKLDIQSHAAVIEYTNGDGDDTIYGYNPSDTVKLKNGTITSSLTSGNDLILKIGTGSMRFVDALSVNVDGKIINPSSKNGTTGKDFLTNFDSNVTLNGYNNGDIISNSGSNVIINADEGNNTIGNYLGDSVIINTGNGNNKIFTRGYDNKIYAGSGNDSILLGWGASKNKVVSGAGDDTIINYSNSDIDGGAGNDYIEARSAEKTTIKGGDGDDTIYALERTGDIVISYANNNGNDVIYGYKTKDTIRITDSSAYSTINSGNDIIFYFKSGSMTFKDSKNVKLNIVGGTYDSNLPVSTVPGNITYVKLTNKDKSPYNAASGVGTVSGAEERTKAIKIVGNDKPNVLIGGIKNDTLVGGGGVDTFVSGAGKDYVTDYTEGEVVSLTGSLTRAAASGNNVTLTSSKGTMVLTDAKGKKVTFVDASGNTTKQTFGVPMVNVVDGDGATINTTYDTAVSTLNGSTRTEGITLIGNKINNTIIGGSGNDILTSGAGKDLFIYTGGDDVITDYAPGKDTIKLEGASITSVSYTGSQSTDLVLTTDKGTLTIENAMSMKSSGGKVVKTPQKITIIHSDGTTTSQTYQLSAAASGVNTFSGGTGADTIYGFSSNDLLTGGKGKDVFIYGAGNDTITDYTAKQDEIKLNIGNASDYSVNGKDVIFTIDAANSLTVKDGAGKSIKVNSVEKVYKDYVNVVLTDQDTSSYTANDSRTMTIDASKRTKSAITITGNANDNTITGGKKNDTLTGGAGADTFVYNNGYGNDVITDYSANEGDIIQLGKNTAVTGITYNGNDLILTVGKGKITVKGGARQAVTVFDDNDAEMIYKKRTLNGYDERAYAELWFAEDNNILTEDVDSILKVDFLSDSKAIGKVSIDYDADDLLIDKQSATLITYNESKKMSI